MGDYVMTCAIFVCLFALGLIALSKPLRTLMKLMFSAALGSFVLFLGQSTGVAVGVNGVTVAVSAMLGLPGVAGMYILSFLL